MRPKLYVINYCLNSNHMDLAKTFAPVRSRYLVFTWDLLLPLLISLLVLLSAWVILFSPIFAIQQIDCQLDYEPCQDPSLLAELDRLRTHNLFRLNQAAITSRLLSANYMLRSVELTRELPSRLHFSLYSIYPVVALRTAQNPNWVVLDSDFRVIRSLGVDPNVPTVIVPGPLTLVIGSSPSDPALRQTLELALDISRAMPQIRVVTLLDERTLSLSLPNSRQALLNPQSKTAEQLRSLQALQLDDTILTGVSVIDLRYSQPVLK